MYVHPIHNLAVVRYDPTDPRLEGVEIRGAKVKPVSAADVLGETAWLIGVTGNPITGVQRVACHRGVLHTDELNFPLTNPPRFMDQNLDYVSFENAGRPIAAHQVATHAAIAFVIFVVDDDGDDDRME